jgi:hypothetical protein
MPIDPALADSVQARDVREVLSGVFPADRYNWLPPSDASAFETRDGSHLTPKSARKFWTTLQAELSASVSARAATR